MTNGNGNSINVKPKDIKAIGAFCTDIENSVDRIDSHGVKALKHHASYIEIVAKVYGKQLKIQQVTRESMKILVKRSNFWIPGDALWGVVWEEPGKSAHDSIVDSFTRVLNACARGLVEAHNKALELTLRPLRIRGAMIGGQVLVKEIKELNSILYNGGSLNACGRLQGQATPNSLILGFVFTGNEQQAELPVDLNIGSPAIQVSEFSECLNKLKLGYPELGLCKPGCNLIFETVESRDGKKLIRFSSIPGKIRGLKGCTVITTRVKLDIENHHVGIRMHDHPAGSWGRSTVKVENSPASLSLIDLVKRAPNSNFTLPEAYRGDNVQIQPPKKDGEDFILRYHGERYRPRAGVNRKTVNTVDFKEYNFCCLPIFRTSFKDIVLLIRKGKNKSLVLHEISGQLNDTYEDLSTLIDSAGECAEFIFD